MSHFSADRENISLGWSQSEKSRFVKTYTEGLLKFTTYDISDRKRTFVLSVENVMRSSLLSRVENQIHI